MAVPWLRLIDGMLGARNLARTVRNRTLPSSDPSSAMEAPLVGVVLGALREAFTRDSQRLDLERQRLDDERARAERALQLEMLRQAGEREVSRLRLMGGAALASLFGALLLATLSHATSAGPRVAVGVGALLLLGALAASFAAHAQVSRRLAHPHNQTSPDDIVVAPSARAVPWLLLGGLGALVVGVLIT